MRKKKIKLNKNKYSSALIYFTYFLLIFANVFALIAVHRLAKHELKAIIANDNEVNNNRKKILRQKKIPQFHSIIPILFLLLI